MKKVLPLSTVLIASLVSMIFVSGCVTPVNNEISTDAVTDSKNGFFIEYPEDWEIRKGVSGTKVMGFSPSAGPNDKFHENLSVGTEDLSSVKSLTLDKYFELSEGHMKKAVKGFKREFVSDTAFAGVPAKELVYTFELGNYTIKGCMMLMKKGDTGYIVTATATDETFDEFKPAFDKIFATFKFVPKKEGIPELAESKIVNGRYINTKYIFSMDIPKGWDHKDNQAGRIMFLFSPLEANDNFRENINVGIEKVPDGMSEDQYMKLSVVNMKKMVKGLKDLGESELKINGLSARRLDYEFKMNELDVRGMTYIIFHDNKSYLLTCGMLKSSFNKYEKIMSKIAKSFKIEK